MSIPDNHRVMVMRSAGAAPELEERPVSTPLEGEVLIKVHASSVNFHDTVNLAGLIWGPWPRVPMTDGAGEIVALGSGVTTLAVGDRVMGAFHPGWLDGAPTPQAKAEVPGDSGDGWLQQYRIAKVEGLVASPAHLSDIEAATLPCAGVTAWNALLEANIGEGDVVVTQGTGGVSLFAVQLARALGASVILTSSSDEKLEIGSRLGATHVINYRDKPEWDVEVKRITNGRGADLVVDLGGPETLAKSVRASRMGGTVAVIGVLTGFDVAPIPVADVMLNNIRLIGITVGSVLSFAAMCKVMARDGIRPHISHVFDWNDLGEAVRVLQSGEHVGKIALRIP